MLLLTDENFKGLMRKYSFDKFKTVENLDEFINQYGHELLSFAFSCNRIDLAELFLAKGAKVYDPEKNEQPVSGLFYNISYYQTVDGNTNDNDIIKMLNLYLINGGPINGLIDKRIKTLISSAVLINRPDVVKFLLEAGAQLVVSHPEPSLIEYASSLFRRCSEMKNQQDIICLLRNKEHCNLITDLRRDQRSIFSRMSLDVMQHVLFPMIASPKPL